MLNSALRKYLVTVVERVVPYPNLITQVFWAIWIMVSREQTDTKKIPYYWLDICLQDNKPMFYLLINVFITVYNAWNWNKPSCRINQTHTVWMISDRRLRNSIMRLIYVASCVNPVLHITLYRKMLIPQQMRLSCVCNHKDTRMHHPENFNGGKLKV